MPRLKPVFDDIDKAIIDCLVEDSSQAIEAIAKSVGLSRNAVQLRIKNLKDRGIIQKYTVHVDMNAFRDPVKAFLNIYLGPGKCAAVLPDIVEFEGIVSCYSISGDIDMILYVEVESQGHLNKLRDQLEKLPEVMEVKTFPVLVERFDWRRSRAAPEF